MIDFVESRRAQAEQEEARGRKALNELAMYRQRTCDPKRSAANPFER